MKSVIQRLLSQESDRDKGELAILSPGGMVYMLRAKRLFKANGIEYWRAPLPDEIRNCGCLIGLEFNIEDYDRVVRLLEENRIPRVTVYKYTDIPGYETG